MPKNEAPTEYQIFRQRLSIGLALLCMAQSFSPFAVALANPALFSKSGAGVSSVPLSVMSFDTPEFGELRDAINLANGNMYLDAGDVSRNSTLNSGDNQNTLQLGNWNLKGRWRLVNALGDEFKSGWVSGTTPAIDGWQPSSITSQVFLELGDGSRLKFNKVDQTNLPENAPTWIKKRYQNTTGAAFYRSVPEVANSIPETWVVFVRTVNGTYAHYYDMQGNRNSFHKDGAYLDYIQTLAQQYRSASRTTAPDSEGDQDATGVIAPRTDITYIGGSSGKIDLVTDEQGRVTDYDWNTDGTLKSIDYKYNGTTTVRKTEFSYRTQAGFNLLSGISYSTWNGQGNTLALNSKRTFDFTYQSISFSGIPQSAVLLTAIKRDITTSTGSTGEPSKWTYNTSNLTTTYNYNVFGTTKKFYAVSSVTRPGAENVTYNYLEGEGKDGGLKVTVSQKDQQSEYLYDTQGRLRERRQKADQPAIPGESALLGQWLNWKYEYYNSGLLALESQPNATDGAATGATTHFVYDNHGNVVRKNTYSSYTKYLEDKDVLRLKLLPQTVDGLDASNGFYSGDTAVFKTVVENDTSNLGVTWEVNAQPIVTMPKFSEFGKPSAWLLISNKTGQPYRISDVAASVVQGSTPSALKINQVEPYDTLTVRRAGGLPPGTYRIHLKARNLDQDEKSSGTLKVGVGGSTYGFTVGPKWTDVTFTAENLSGNPDDMISLSAISKNTLENSEGFSRSWEFDELTVTPVDPGTMLPTSLASQQWIPAAGATRPNVSIEPENLPSFESQKLWTVKPSATSTSNSGFKVPTPPVIFNSDNVALSFWIRSLGQSFNLKTVGQATENRSITGQWTQVNLSFNKLDLTGLTPIELSTSNTENIPYQIYGMTITTRSSMDMIGYFYTRWNVNAGDLQIVGLKPQIEVGFQANHTYVITPKATATSSGVQTTLKAPKGKYVLSYEAKADVSTDIYHSVGALTPVKSTLGSTWKTITQTIDWQESNPITLKIYQNNTNKWLIKNLSMRYLDGKVMNLPTGTEAYGLKVVATAVANPGQKAEVNLPVKSRVSQVYIATPTGDLKLPTDQVAKDKTISVRYSLPDPSSLSYNPTFRLEATVTGTADANKKLRWYSSGGTVTPDATDSSKATFTPPAWKMGEGASQQFDIVAVSEDNPNEWYIKTVEARYFGAKFRALPTPYLKASNWKWGFPSGYSEPFFYQYQLEIKNLPPVKDRVGIPEIWFPKVQWKYENDPRTRASITKFGCVRPGEVNWWEGGDPVTSAKVTAILYQGTGPTAALTHETQQSRSGQATNCSFPFSDTSLYNNGIFMIDGVDLMVNDLWKTIIPGPDGPLVVTKQEAVAPYAVLSKNQTTATSNIYQGDDAPVTLDPNTNPQITDFSTKEHAGWLNKTEYVYDQDNHLIQTLQSASNLRGDQSELTVPYSLAYTHLNTASEWTNRAEKTVNANTTNSQTFTDVLKIKSSERTGGALITSIPTPDTVISLAGGTEKRNTTVTFNSNGLMESVVLAWGTKSRTTTFTYPPRDATGKYTTATVGDALWLNERIVDQMPDRVQKQVVTAGSTGGSVTHEFTYDEFGNLIQDKTVSGLGQALPATLTTAPTFKHLYDQKTFNGFNQLIWQGKKADGSTKYDSESYLNYSSTGALLSSWEGMPSNVTAYHYNTNGFVDAVAKGTPTDTNQNRSLSANKYATQPIVTYRDLTENSTIDGFGRPTLQKRNGFYNAIVYDSLGRVVQEVLKDGSGTAQHYGFTQQVTFKVKFKNATLPDAPSPTNTTPVNYASAKVRLTETWSHNNFGWVTQQTRQASLVGTATTLNTQTLTIKNAYDEQGRVVVTTLTGEETNKISTNETMRTINKYDSEGNLLYTVGPALNSSPKHGFEDKRMTVTVNTYDEINRKLTSTQLLDSAGSALNYDSPLSLALSTSKATTTYQYDDLNRIKDITDAENYVTYLYYDPLGNVIKTTRNLWTGRGYLNKPSDTDINISKDSTSTLQAYDAAGRTIAIMDPQGSVARTLYNPLGRVLAQSDFTGNVTKAHKYTGDGLLEATYVPKLTGTRTSLVAFDDSTLDSATSVFDRIQVMEYGNTPWPKVIGEANMDTLPVITAGKVDLQTGSVTKFTYNHLGKPLTTTLPDARTIEQDYDEDGNVIRMKDAAGFTTTFDYDPSGQLLEKHELPRTQTNTATNTTSVVDTDKKAGFTDQSSGLEYKYTYDLFGNLVKKQERNLITEYDYNMLGKVVAESRPHTSSVQSPLWKHYVYRLDGTKVAETNYAYTGDLTTPTKYVSVDSSSDPSNALSVTTFSTPTAGNLRIWEVDGLGRIVKETSKGVDSNGFSRPMEYLAEYLYNGQGLKVRRIFRGDAAIYAQQINTNDNLDDSNFGKPITTTDSTFGGTGNQLPSTTYHTYWNYDLRGLLTSKFDRAIIDPTQSTKTAKQNEFTYEYDVNGQETLSKRDVRVFVRTPKSINGNNTQDAAFNDAALMLAATVGRTRSYYNNRGLLYYTTVEDQSPSKEGKALEVKFPQTTTYGYYVDGKKKTITVSPGKTVGTKTFKYDLMGREIEVEDSNGATNFQTPDAVFTPSWPPEQQAVDKNKFAGKSKITTNYSNFPDVETTLYSEAYKCSVTQKQEVTVGGRIYKSTVTQPACGSGVVSNKPDNLITSYNMTVLNTYDKYSGLQATSQYTSTGSAPAQEKYTVTSHSPNPTGPWGLRLEKREILDANGVLVPIHDYKFVSDTFELCGCKFTVLQEGPVTLSTDWARYDRYKYDLQIDSTSTSTYSRTTTNTPDAYGNILTSTSVIDQTSSTSNTFTYGNRYSLEANSNYPSPDSSERSGGSTFRKELLDVGGYSESNCTTNNNQGNGGSTKTCSSPQVTETITRSFNADGALQGDSTQSNKTATVVRTFTLDSLGKTILFNSTDPKQYRDYQKRYNAEQNVTTFYNRQDFKEVWNHFVYDPTGQQVLSSTGGIRQCNNTLTSLCPDTSGLQFSEIERDMNATYYSSHEVQMIRHRNGEFGYKYQPAKKFLWFTTTDATIVGVATYEDTNNIKYHQVKDETFSLADGQTDDVKWSGVVVFDAEEERETTEDVPADVIPSSITGAITPLDITPTEPINVAGGNLEGVTKSTPNETVKKDQQPQSKEANIPSSPEITRFEPGMGPIKTQVTSTTQDKKSGESPNPVKAPSADHVPPTVSNHPTDETEQNEPASVILGGIEGATSGVMTHDIENASPGSAINPEEVTAATPTVPSLGIHPSDEPSNVVPSTFEPALPKVGPDESIPSEIQVYPSKPNQNEIHPSGYMKDATTFCPTDGSNCVDVMKAVDVGGQKLLEEYLEFLKMNEAEKVRNENQARDMLTQAGRSQNEYVDLAFVLGIIHGSKITQKEKNKAISDINQMLKEGASMINIARYAFEYFFVPSRESNGLMCVGIVCGFRSKIPDAFAALDTVIYLNQFSDSNSITGGLDVLGMFLLMWGFVGTGTTLNLNNYFSLDLLGKYFNSFFVPQERVKAYSTHKFRNAKWFEFPKGKHDYISETKDRLEYCDYLSAICLLGGANDGLKVFGTFINHGNGLYSFDPYVQFNDRADANFIPSDVLRVIGLSLIAPGYKPYNITFIFPSLDFQTNADGLVCTVKNVQSSCTILYSPK